MATYLELHGLKNDSDFQEKIEVAVVVAAQVIKDDQTPPANQTARLAWAASAMTDPRNVAKSMLWAVLAANREFSTSQILGATDAAIQTNVNEAVDLFAGT